MPRPFFLLVVGGVADTDYPEPPQKRQSNKIGAFLGVQALNPVLHPFFFGISPRKLLRFAERALAFRKAQAEGRAEKGGDRKRLGAVKSDCFTGGFFGSWEQRLQARNSPSPRTLA